MYTLNKGIKVFISSTFRDLDKERDYIVKSVFPRIEQKLNGREVREVDLRWGITEEQANSGLVVDLCLSYLIDSRPFIIGILGDRYGTSFSGEVKLSPKVMAAFPQVHQQLASGKSITEIEIINGALESSEEDIRAIFFVKETSAPAPGETMEQYYRLCAIKDRIKQQDRFPVYAYTDLLDLDNIIEFVTDNVPSQYKYPVTDEIDYTKINTYRNLNHYRESDIYDSKVLKDIYKVIEQGSPVSVLEGSSGIGKSTLLAHLGVEDGYRYRKFIYIYGDVVVKPFSVNSFQKYFFKVAETELAQVDKRVAYSDRYLVSAISRTKWCIVLDNFTHGYTEVPYLSGVIARFAEWMNQKFKTELDYKILVVKNSDARVESGVLSSYATYKLTAGDFFSPGSYIQKYMAAFSKTLTSGQVALMTSSKGARNPMALEMMCDFLRENVSFDELNKYIGVFSRLESWQDVISLYMEYLISNCDRTDLRSIVLLLCTYTAPFYVKDLRECSGVDNLSFNVIMSYLDKLLKYNFDGRVVLKNETVRNVFIKTFDLKSRDFADCAEKCYRYFEGRTRDLFTQEDFILESDKEFGLYRLSWEHVIPRYYYWRYPSRSELSFGKDWETLRYLGLCGGKSFENASKAYHSFRYGHISFFYQTVFEFNRRKQRDQVSDSDMASHKEWMDKTAAIIDKLHNPSIYDVIFELESLMLLKKTDSLKRLLSNPTYANRILNTRYFAQAWEWLIRNGYDLKDDVIKGNTLFPPTAYSDMCLLLNRQEEAEFYMRKARNNFEFWEKSVDDVFASNTGVVAKETVFFSDGGAYCGDLDFFRRPHKSGYYEYPKEGSGHNTYIGEFKHGARHGKGIYFCADGKIYEGEWKKDQLDGKGTIASPCGELCEGNFVKGVMNGYGRYVFKSGNVYEGEFKDNEFCGKGKFYWTSGTWCEGIWENNELIDGTAVYHYAGQ